MSNPAGADSLIRCSRALGNEKLKYLKARRWRLELG